MKLKKQREIIDLADGIKRLINAYGSETGTNERLMKQAIQDKTEQINNLLK